MLLRPFIKIRISRLLSAANKGWRQLNLIKSPQEIAYISQTAHLACGVWQELVDHLKKNINTAGLTEIALAEYLEELLMEAGSGKLPFAPIVASGPNSAKPHAEPSERKIQAGDLVVIDYGASWHGYSSDFTRTLVIGQPSDEQKKVYQAVADAQSAVLAKVKPGMSCFELDALARKIISQAGYGQYFIHGLGHGVGLLVHEAPSLAATSGDQLESNMVITIEPGIYIPDWGGVRQEDLVVVTEGGPKILTELPRELVVIE